MNTIFLVTEGEYSDYHVIGAFSTNEKADIFKNSISGANVEYYEIDPPLDHILVGRGEYGIVMFDDGNVDRIWKNRENSPADHVNTGFDKLHERYDKKKVFTGSIFAYSEEEAIKIAGDTIHALQKPS